MSKFVLYNANPEKIDVIDCTIRAISLLLNQTWEDTYIGIAAHGLLMHNMPSSNKVWGEYLKRNGYIRARLPNTCPDCYTVKDFCNDFPIGSYLLALDEHVVAVIDGKYYDTWDSGNEVPLYYWRKE